MTPQQHLQKLLIAEIKDASGVRIITAMKHPVDWVDLQELVEMDLDGGCQSTRVKFYRRTQKWLDKQPEYEG